MMNSGENGASFSADGAEGWKTDERGSRKHRDNSENKAQSFTDNSGKGSSNRAYFIMSGYLCKKYNKYQQKGCKNMSLASMQKVIPAAEKQSLPEQSITSNQLDGNM